MKGMKRAFALLFALSCCGEAQQRSPYDNINAPYYQIKSSIYRSMPRHVDGIHLNGAGVLRQVEFLSKWIGM